MMNKLRSALTIGILAVGLFLTTDAQAQASPPGQYSTIVVKSGISFGPVGSTTPLVGVAAGAVITGPVLNLQNTTTCSVFADNSAGGATRALNVNYLADDGTTIVFQSSTTVAIAGRSAVVLGASVAAGTLPTGVVILPVPPSKFMSFQLAAGGAAAGSLQWTCR